jgi:uncharacterized protein YpuA (DUF1002 family)
MSNDVINDTDLTSRDKQYLAKLFVKVYKEVDWSKVSKEINIEISWLNYAFRLTAVQYPLMDGLYLIDNG